MRAIRASAAFSSLFRICDRTLSRSRSAGSCHSHALQQASDHRSVESAPLGRPKSLRVQAGCDLLHRPRQQLIKIRQLLKPTHRVDHRVLGDNPAGPVALNLSVLSRALQMDFHRSSVVQSAYALRSWITRGGVIRQ